eukprot:406967_1
MSSTVHSKSKVLIYLKFVGCVTSIKVPIDIQVGSSIKNLKQIIHHLNPHSTVHRILFGGKIINLNDEDKLLTDYSIYKECLVMVFLKQCKSQSINIDEKQVNENTCWIYDSNAIDKQDILQRLLKSISDNEINIQTTENLNQIVAILKLNGAIITSDVPSATLYFSGINMTEPELFQYLSEIMPNKIKSIHYNNIDTYSYAIVQCKNTLDSLQLLLNIKINSNTKFKSFTSFGPPTCYQHDSIIEGFLQLSMPKTSNYIEFTYYWCRISKKQFQIYESLYNNAILSFPIDKIDPMIIDHNKTEITIHINNTIIIIRSMNQVWENIMLQFAETINNGLQIEKRKLNKNGIWYKHKCYLSKVALPLIMLYSPDGHKWWADRKMLKQYICVNLQKGQIDQITTRFTTSDVKDLVSEKTFKKYNNYAFERLIQSKPKFTKCPKCSVLIELLPLIDDICQEEQILMNKLQDGQGKRLSCTLQQHWRQYRIKCRNKECMIDFCSNCQFFPYHLGDTCETMKYDRCRFCDSRLTPLNRVQKPLSES